MTEQTGTTRQVEPLANDGVAITSNGTPVGSVIEESRIDGAVTTKDQVVQKVGKINFSADFTLTLENDGSVTISLA